MNKTCGMRHYQQTQSLPKSIRSTESGKLKSSLMAPTQGDYLKKAKANLKKQK